MCVQKLPNKGHSEMFRECGVCTVRPWCAVCMGRVYNVYVTGDM